MLLVEYLFGRTPTKLTIVTAILSSAFTGVALDYISPSNPLSRVISIIIGIDIGGGIICNLSESTRTFYHDSRETVDPRQNRVSDCPFCPTGVDGLRCQWVGHRLYWNWLEFVLVWNHVVLQFIFIDESVPPWARR